MPEHRILCTKHVHRFDSAKVGEKSHLFSKDIGRLRSDRFLFLFPPFIFFLYSFLVIELFLEGEKCLARRCRFEIIFGV